MQFWANHLPLCLPQVTAEIQCDFRNSAGTRALLDAAVDNATALASSAAAFTAYPCYRHNATLLTPTVPSYLGTIHI